MLQLFYLFSTRNPFPVIWLALLCFINDRILLIKDLLSLKIRLLLLHLHLIILICIIKVVDRIIAVCVYLGVLVVFGFLMKVVLVLFVILPDDLILTAIFMQKKRVIS